MKAFALVGGLTEEEIRNFHEQQKGRQCRPGQEPVKKAAQPAISTKLRSSPLSCPPGRPSRTANGIHRLAMLDVGSYGSKLSDSDSETEQ